MNGVKVPEPGLLTLAVWNAKSPSVAGHHPLDQVLPLRVAQSKVDFGGQPVLAASSLLRCCLFRHLYYSRG